MWKTLTFVSYFKDRKDTFSWFIVVEIGSSLRRHEAWDVIHIFLKIRIGTYVPCYEKIVFSATDPMHGVRLGSDRKLFFFFLVVIASVVKLTLCLSIYTVVLHNTAIIMNGVIFQSCKFHNISKKKNAG